MQDRTIVVLATDARINERLIARGMDPMRGPCLAEILHEATGERLTSKEALRLWDPGAAGRRPAGARGAEPLRRAARPEPGCGPRAGGPAPMS